MESLLEPALDSGIKESDFWNMTIGEVIRAVESKNRVKKAEAQQQASFDYVLANLIAKNISIVLGSKQASPKLEEVYPNLFYDMEDKRQEKIKEQQTNLSTLRFLQFAQSYNQRLKSKEVPKEINE